MLLMCRIFTVEWTGTSVQSNVEIDLYHCGNMCNNSVSVGSYAEHHNRETLHAIIVVSCTQSHIFREVRVRPCERVMKRANKHTFSARMSLFVVCYGCGSCLPGVSVAVHHPSR